jgi:hypothetical protein
MDYPVSGKAPNVAEAMVPHTVDGSGNAVPLGGEASATLTETIVNLTGSSQDMLAADANRRIVIVANAATNNDAAVSLTNQTASLTQGIPAKAGIAWQIAGKAAQSAMKCIGTNGQKLTVYTG